MKKSHYVVTIAVLIALNLLVFSCQNETTTIPNNTEVVDNQTTDNNTDEASTTEVDSTAIEKLADAEATTEEDVAASESSEKAEETKEIAAKEAPKEKPATMNTPAAPPKPKVKKPKKPATPMAKFQFEEKEYNFGTIKVGTKVEHDFYFTNTGKVPMVITGANSTCGCTIPEVPSEPIPPGGQNKVKVTFDSTGKIGMQDKHVTITANTYPRNTVIHMKGLALTANMMPGAKTTTASPSPYSSPKLSTPATTTPAAVPATTPVTPKKEEIPVNNTGNTDGGNSLVPTTDQPAATGKNDALKSTTDNKDQ
ncbi:MAG: DUF1573 domain-containing protein [Chitinophagales bacterium]